MIGQTVSHYRILEKLGEGGMGVVYRAEDLKLTRTVALKFLPHGLDAHEPERARFLQEARAAAILNHPNICTIHDIAEHQGQQFIVMEYVEGRTLREVVPVRKLQDAVSYANQMAEALQEAHTHGIVHRDIKSENIMVNTKNQVKVMDFGLAKLKGSLKLTKTSSTIGTVAYMAPEQIQGGDVDARSDIFSFGIVLYEMLTGQLPFPGEHEAAVVYSIVNEEPAPVQKYLPDVPSELVHILDRALEKDPEDRYQTAHDLVIDLRRIKRHTSRVSRTVSVSPPAGIAPAAEKEPSAVSQPDDRRKERAHRILSWLLAGAVVVSAGIIAWMLFQTGPPETSFKAGRSQQITSEPGVEIDPALSPDGRMIAYCAPVDGTMRVHVKQVTGGRTLCLTRDLPGHQRLPSWSGDGSHVMFVSSEPGLALYRMPALGGSPERIADSVWSGAVSPGGTHIVRGYEDTVCVQELDGTEVKRLATLYEPHSFRWSPDGSLVCMVSGNQAYLSTRAMANIAPSTVCVVSTSEGWVRQITDNSSLNTSPVWAGDSRHLMFVSDRDGTRDIYHVALDQSGRPVGEPGRLTTGLHAYTISLSADAKTLAYSVLAYSANIWSVPIPKRGSVSASEAVQVTTGNQAIEGLDVSTDGRWIAYDSNREGNQDIYRMSLTGGEPIRMTTDPADDFLPAWSPDGRSIAFYSFRMGNRDLFVMSSDGGPQHRITRDPAHERYPDWSPDGKRLVFYSDKTGRQELYVTSKSPEGTTWEEPRQLTFEEGAVPRWSPDGALIAYVSFAGGQRLCVISPNGGSPTVLVDSPDGSPLARPSFPAWSSDGGTVYYMARDRSQRPSVWAVPVSGGNARLLLSFDDPARQSHRDEFATDGERFYFTLSRYESDIWKMDLIADD